MVKKFVSFILSVFLLLTSSSCAAAESLGESVASMTVSSTLEESSPVESQAMALSENGAFADVTPGDWFYEAVEYCREHGLMSGKEADRFASADNMTRAELAAVLYRHAESSAVTIFWRYAGSPEVGQDAQFADMSEVSGYASVTEDRMEWVCYPVCGNKTRVKVRNDTVLLNFPLHCPKCKNVNLIEMENSIIRKMNPAQLEAVRTKDLFDCILPGLVHFMSDYYIVGDSYRFSC